MKPDVRVGAYMDEGSRADADELTFCDPDTGECIINGKYFVVPRLVCFVDSILLCSKN